MALFRRDKTDQAGMPTEVQDYYTSQKRERTGLAWLLALGTLLVTVLLVLGLFFGGRWVFRQLKDNDDQAPVAVQNENDESKEEENKPAESTANDSPAPATQTPPAATPTPTPTPAATTPTPATTPAAGSASNSNLPNTGPGDTLAIFAAISVLAYFAHRRFLVS